MIRLQRKLISRHSVRLFLVCLFSSFNLSASTLGRKVSDIIVRKNPDFSTTTGKTFTGGEKSIRKASCPKLVSLSCPVRGCDWSGVVRDVSAELEQTADDGVYIKKSGLEEAERRIFWNSRMSLKNMGISRQVVLCGVLLVLGLSAASRTKRQDDEEDDTVAKVASSPDHPDFILANWNYTDHKFQETVEQMMKRMMPMVIRGSSSIELSGPCMQSLFKLMMGVRQSKVWAYRRKYLKNYQL